MSLVPINHLLQSYGCFSVFVFIAVERLGVPMPGETTLIAAVSYTGCTHRLNIAAVIGDNVGYWIGRRGGTRLARRYRHRVGFTLRRLELAGYLFDRHLPVPAPVRALAETR